MDLIRNPANDVNIVRDITSYAKMTELSLPMLFTANYYLYILNLYCGIFNNNLFCNKYIRLFENNEVSK